jgi:hypothetical protein
VNVAAFVIGTTGFDGGSLLARSVGRLAPLFDRAILCTTGAGVAASAFGGTVVGEVAVAIAGVGAVDADAALVAGRVVDGTVIGGMVVVGALGAQLVGASTWPQSEVA